MKGFTFFDVRLLKMLLKFVIIVQLDLLLGLNLALGISRYYIDPPRHGDRVENIRTFLNPITSELEIFDYETLPWFPSTNMGISWRDGIELTVVENPNILPDIRKLGIQDLPNDCGKFYKSSTRIAGGRTATTGEFPSYVYINFQTDNGLFCGGNILSEWFILTAAHCVDTTFDSSYREIPRIYPTLVRPESSRRFNVNVKEYKAEKVCMSDNFPLDSAKLVHDVAIFRVSEPILFSTTVQPVCLPDKDYIIGQNRSFSAIGLGKMNEFDHPDLLQAIPFKHHPCEDEDLDQTNICMVSKDPSLLGDTCSGDSGGGIITTDNNKHVLVAITSYGPDACEQGKAGYSVNADIYALRNEINELINECSL